jgi:hypothetical protein
MRLHDRQARTDLTPSLGEVRFAPRRNKPSRLGKRLRAVANAFFIELNIACMPQAAY